MTVWLRKSTGDVGRASPDMGKTDYIFGVYSEDGFLIVEKAMRRLPEAFEEIVIPEEPNASVLSEHHQAKLTGRAIDITIAPPGLLFASYDPAGAILKTDRTEQNGPIWRWEVKVEREKKTAATHLTDTLHARILLSVGEASMCWEHVHKAGVFKSSDADRIATQLHRFVNDHFAEST